jgi:hypothetical protein
LHPGLYIIFLFYVSFFRCGGLKDNKHLLWMSNVPRVNTIQDQDLKEKISLELKFEPQSPRMKNSA